MTYKETIDYLYNSTPVFEHVGASAYKEGLSNTHILDNYFGHPHTQYLTIHIAGTNGKGSCSHTLASILQEDGYRVGLYTSPHLVDFRERIRVNGKMIPEQYVVDFVNNEHSFFEPLHPSFFELTTALAFKYFADQHVDIAVIEVGLGGRLDCTNIIHPLLSIITNISFDHTQFLGNTLEKIAYEKAGIIKHNTPIVIGEYTQETRPTFINKAQEQNAPITFAQDLPQIKSYHVLENGHIKYDTIPFGLIEGELGGIYQVSNTNTILSACTFLLSNNIIRHIDSVKEGFRSVCKNTGLMGRWQHINSHPLTICDTGHNVGGWQYLSKQISHQPCKHRHIVFGMVDDKDIDTVLEVLPKDACFYWTQASCKRAVPANLVAQKALTHHLTGSSYRNVKDAYKAALMNASPEDFIFIGGSSYIVAYLLTP